jgi:hypothetical protein
VSRNKSSLFASHDRSYARRSLCVASTAKMLAFVSASRPVARNLFRMLIVCLGTAFRLLHANESRADAVYHNLGTSGNFSQNWTNTGLITASDDWSGVSSIQGFSPNDVLFNDANAASIDLQTRLSDVTTAQKVIANEPSTSLGSAGVAEFQITNPVVALRGSASNDTPYLQIFIESTGRSNITLSYRVRDIDSTHAANQQLALHYRVGEVGDFTNVPSAWLDLDPDAHPDAEVGIGGEKYLDVVVSDSSWANQSKLQFRIMTANAQGATADEWIGIDDILITSVPEPSAVLMFLLGAFGILRYAGRKRRVISAGELT